MKLQEDKATQTPI